MTINYDLSRCPLFVGIERNILNNIIQRTIVTTQRFNKGDIITQQKSPINYLYLLVDGVVSTEMITPEGNIINIDILEGVVPLALAFMYMSNPKFPVAVVAIKPSVIYYISKDNFLKEMMANETLFKNFLKITANITSFLSTKVAMLSIKSLKAKIAKYILENTSYERNSFTLKRNQTQLAEYLGVQRPSLARTLGELINENIIIYRKKEIVVINRNYLESIC